MSIPYSWLILAVLLVFVVCMLIRGKTWKIAGNIAKGLLFIVLLLMLLKGFAPVFNPPVTLSIMSKINDSAEKIRLYLVASNKTPAGISDENLLEFNYNTRRLDFTIKGDVDVEAVAEILDKEGLFETYKAIGITGTTKTGTTYSITIQKPPANTPNIGTQMNPQAKQ